MNIFFFLENVWNILHCYYQNPTTLTSSCNNNIHNTHYLVQLYNSETIHTEYRKKKKPSLIQDTKLSKKLCLKSNTNQFNPLGLTLSGSLIIYTIQTVGLVECLSAHIRIPFLVKIYSLFVFSFFLGIWKSWCHHKDTKCCDNWVHSKQS